MVQSKIDNHCPIPKTHHRLIDGPCALASNSGKYHQPELFQANLNSTIQALRNITFILQSEKNAFPDFENWYNPWQEGLKENLILKWLKGARNTIVKQGDLEISSTAIIKLVGWEDDILGETNIPAEIPTTLILQNIPLLELLK